MKAKFGIESQAKAATADAQRKVALAKGDSAVVVIEASSVAQAMKLRHYLSTRFRICAPKALLF